MQWIKHNARIMERARRAVRYAMVAWNRENVIAGTARISDSRFKKG
jgi:hypothetical protein